MSMQGKSRRQLDLLTAMHMVAFKSQGRLITMFDAKGCGKSRLSKIIEKLFPPSPSKAPAYRSRGDTAEQDPKGRI